MALTIGTGLSLFTQLRGLLEGGDKGGDDRTANAIAEFFRETIQQVRDDDPTARIREGFEFARQRTREDAETTLGNVFSRFAQQGSTPGLPDTARASVLRGATSDIFRDLGFAQAQAESTAFERGLQNRLSVIQLGQSGRGRNDPAQPSGFNAGAFSRTAGRAFEEIGFKL